MNHAGAGLNYSKNALYTQMRPLSERALPLSSPLLSFSLSQGARPGLLQAKERKVLLYPRAPRDTKECGARYVAGKTRLQKAEEENPGRFPAAPPDSQFLRISPHDSS